MPLILGSNAPAADGYEIDNSLRFDDGSSDSLTRVPASSGNRDKWTLSMWIKRSETGVTNETLTNVSGGAGHAIQFQSSDTLRWFEGGGSTSMLIPTQVFRDISAWYHFVFVWDSGNATSSNRAKIYLNGEQITAFGTATYPSLNANSTWNAGANTHYIGDASASYIGFSGYMAEVVFINDQALDPTSFGEFDADSGIWKPIDVSGLTFGTNGFYLPFENSAALGQDDSGNGNNFTVNNLTSIDQTTDTPTNNFATLNPLAQTKTKGTVSQGNLEYDRPGSTDTFVSILSTIGASAGKWYAEIKIIDVGSPTQGCVLGFLNLDESDIQSSSSTHIGATTGDAGMGWYSLGNVFSQGATIDTINSYTDNDIVMLAMDLDNGYCYFGKNGSWENSGVPTSGSSGTGGYATSNMTANGTYCFAISLREAGNVQMNFGNPPFTISSGNSDGNGYGNFEYSVPSGYYALNTKNLAEYG